MPNHKTISYLRLLYIGLTALVASGASFKAAALSPDSYASSSVLSQGNWAKIEVKASGMQFISDATLNSLGFNNPSAVNVYGYGGGMLSENLTSPDDLPLVPSIRVNGGIIFFGLDLVSWDRSSTTTGSYTHTLNPYSDKAYYFVSDVNPERLSPETKDATALSGKTPVTSFTERLVHEQDLMEAMNSGRQMLGEDFSVTPSRTFSFSLPGNIGNATVTTAFACYTNSGTSSLVFTANGKQLPGSSSDNLAYSSTKLIFNTKTVKTVQNPGTSLDLNIRFNGGGTVKKAGLDYIEVEYPRSLNFPGDELYFYLTTGGASDVKISGADASTVIWDVTDPVSPKEIKGVLNGSELSFVADAGYREYIAFNPARVARGATGAGKVQNQDIHSLPAPGLLVISPAEYKDAAQRLSRLHAKTDGLSVLILTPEEIYNEFSAGKPDVTAFRKLLKMWYDRAEGREGEYCEYALIMSRPTYDNKMVTAKVKNAGYPRIPIWQSPTGETSTTTYSTDDYVGMLDDVVGTFNIATAKIRAAIARMPVKSSAEASLAMDKLENYLLNPEYGSWRNNVMVIADDGDSGVHLTQAETSIKAMKDSGNGSDYLYEKLYLDSFTLVSTSTGHQYPDATAKMLNKFSEGVIFVNYIGHANPTSWGHEQLFKWYDINHMSNTRLPFLYAATCEFLRWDDNEVGGGETLWLHPNSGMIGMICPSREVLISANGTLNKSTSQYLFDKDADGNSLPMGKVMILGKNSSNTSTNKLRYAFMGDPTMRLPVPNISVKVDSIDGVELASADELPVIKARGKAEVTGHIEDAEGNLLNDFNGVAELQLFDAEKVITTFGNGSDGVKSNYNDRPTRLYIGKVTVKDGLWSTTVNMPSEIGGNYSPALISLYAYDKNGREANGSCEEFYVYGYDETAPDDFEGPKFIEFYLNSEGFKSGDNVGPSPTLTAVFSDESGISVSDAGIGHQITLELDGKTFYDDVAGYYEPAEDDPTKGSVKYTLAGVNEGKHSLKMTVWDNANNSSSATLEFNISALWKPSIETLTTDANPATTSVNFILATDGSTDNMTCRIEVFDINGRKVWTGNSANMKNSNSRVTMNWDLNHAGGGRVQPGIYLYRATVTTDSGATVTKSRKLIVAQ